ncbi:hypothetical protein ACEWY4_009077 [Coilia grayii]|uniref:Uncharacterized protein n=1 Tax=Coilia grayii TaxID=363190 RepID=A0ABD1K5E7_9TELE
MSSGGKSTSQKKERECRHLRISVLRSELDRQRKALARETDAQHKEKTQLIKKEEAFSMKHQTLEKERELLSEQQKECTAKRELFLKSNAQLTFRCRQLLSELSYIYPIDTNNQSDYVICGVKLPNSEDFQGVGFGGLLWSQSEGCWVVVPLVLLPSLVREAVAMGLGPISQAIRYTPSGFRSDSGPKAQHRSAEGLLQTALLRDLNNQRCSVNQRMMGVWRLPLGYTAHLVLMVSCFLQIPLRYPLIHKGSRSSIRDTITDKLTEKEREFPLYPRGERFQFEYGVYLLNKNIAQMPSGPQTVERFVVSNSMNVTLRMRLVR